MIRKLLFISLYCSLAFAATWKTDLSNGKNEISFEAVGKPGLITVKGTSEHGLAGSLAFHGTALSGTATLHLDTLDTHMSLRNEHMKRTLEVSRYPDAKLTLDSVRVPPQGTRGTEIPFKGKLLLHGVEHEVSGTARIEVEGKALGAQFDFAIKLSDFQITPPTFAKITIRDDVKIHVQGNFPLQG